MPLKIDTNQIKLLSNGIETSIFESNYYYDCIFEYTNMVEQNKQLIKFLNNDTKKLQSTEKLILGLVKNVEIYNEIRTFLINEFGNPPSNYNLKNKRLEYLDSFKYLHRDWSYTANMEYEVEQIIINITRTFDKVSINFHDTALVLGAGYGRLAYELAKQFNEILAVDNSFKMAYLTNKMMYTNIEYGLINLRNNKYSEYKTINGYTSNELQKSIKNVRFLLGDCLNLPIQSNSLSTVFSIFFTDLLPLSEMLPKITNLLKVGGLFFHFGPLSFHFKKITEMYSADEVILIFENYGLHLVLKDEIELPNFNIEGSLIKNYYLNLIYIFKKL